MPRNIVLEYECNKDEPGSGDEINLYYQIKIPVTYIAPFKFL